MPFTFAHPAIVLPVVKKRNNLLNVSAMIIGTMAPDFEYFIHFMPYQKHGHTLMGQFYYNLPLVVVIYLIYHMLLKHALINNLPQSLSKISFILEENWKMKGLTDYIRFISSALIGMLSHITWDAFTHHSGYFVERIDFLSNSISVLGMNIPIYKLLQHGSSICGLLFILAYLYKSIAVDENIHIITKPKAKKSRFWLLLVLLSLAIGVLFLLIAENITIGRIVVTGINAGFISLCILSLLDRLKMSQV